MSAPFPPTQIRSEDYGLDETDSTWVRFRIGEFPNQFVAASLADINVASPDLWRRFGKLGIALSRTDQKALLDQVHRAGPVIGRRHFLVASGIGWRSGRFVLPNRVFGAPAYTIERYFDDLDLRKYRSAESLEQWQDKVLSLCAGNSRLMFSIMCAFAGPLLELLGIGSFGFQLFGESSIGKTIVLIVGGSVWGCRVGATSHLGFIETWATTLEGVARYGRMHNDGFLLLDETRQVGNDRDIGKMVATFIMRLAQGTTKNQLVSVGGRGDWRVVYLGSSNLSLLEMFSAASMDFDDAYRVRFPDIFADAGCGYGVFENIHGFPNAAAFAKELRARACTYFGTASERYLERLSQDRHDRCDWLEAALRRQMVRYHAMVSAGTAVDGRITDQFAVVFAAGMLARDYGIVPWSREEIAWAVQSCERAHHQSVAQNQAKLDPIAAVRAYIASNLSRFRKVPDPSITDQEFKRGAGFIYIDDNGALEYAIPRKVFARGVVPLESTGVLRVLDTAGLLVRGLDKYVSKVPIRSSEDDGRKFVCRIRGSILDRPVS
jgi:putative DNA primase/helicase